MPSLRVLALRLWASLRGERPVSRLEAELAHHQAMLEAERRAQGLDAAEARRAAAIALGGRDQIAEAYRDQRGWPAFEDLLRDLRLGWRSLRRSPGFTVVVVLTLALGIGANAAVFAVMNAMLLRPLPVKDPGQLTLLYWNTRRMPAGLDDSGTNDGLPPHAEGGMNMYSLAYPDFLALREAAAPWAGAVFGFARLGTPAVTVDGAASLAHASLVTQDYFSGLGLAPTRGRLLDAADFQPGAPLVVVISDAFWTSRFGRSPAALGRVIRVDRHPAVIVGVAPRQFQGLVSGFADEVWIPAVPDTDLLPWGGYQPPSGHVYASHAYWWLQVMVRRRSGVSEARLEAALAPRFNALSTADVRAFVHSGEEAPQLHTIAGIEGINSLAESHGAVLRVLMDGVGLLLLLACINVATLLLARASTRRREIGVRMALGAPRMRLIAQLLTESIWLALLGGGLGLALAPLASQGLTTLLVPNGGPAAAPSLDWHVLAFTLAVSLITGIAFGLAPALHCTRLDLNEAVKRGPAPSSARRGVHRMRADKSLAIAQTALSLLLLVGAGLRVRTLINLERQPLGFDPDHVLTFSLDASQAGYGSAALPGFYLNLQARLAALPGVTAVGVSQHSLLGGDVGGDALRVPSSSSPLQWRPGRRNGIGPGFFTSLRIPILSGRAIDEQDVRDARAVAVINASMVRAYFGDADPVGQVLLRSDPNNASTAFTVVGIAGDARYGSLKGQFPATYYIPYTRLRSVQDLTFELRTAGPPASALPAVRQAVKSIEPGIALEAVEPQVSQDIATLGSERLLANLGAPFALLGLLLAFIGIEGTMAYAVVCRSRDIGIRMALGARRGQVLWGVLRETLSLTLAGIAIGLAVAFAAARLIADQLYGVQPSDPLTLAAAALLMLAVAALAGWWPAHRAASVDPMTALRAE